MLKMAGGRSKILQMFNRTIGVPLEVDCRGRGDILQRSQGGKREAERGEKE